MCQSDFLRNRPAAGPTCLVAMSARPRYVPSVSVGYGAATQRSSRSGLSVNSARAALQGSIAGLARALAEAPGAAPARKEDEEGSAAQPGPPRLRLQDWRVVEAMTVGTTDYVLLCRIRATTDPFDALTARERDAVHQACSGASNKEIAHRMGISDSTVRVLVSRAARKVGAADRNALLLAYRARQARVDE